MTDTGKRSPGQPFKVPPAPVWNGMVSAGEAWSMQELGRPNPRSLNLRSGLIVKVKNSSATDLDRGDVLCFADSIIEDVAAEYPWFDGEVPPANYEQFRYGVLLDPQAIGTIGPLQTSGVCIARINVADVKHNRAFLVPSAHQPKSSYAGPIELLTVATATGVQEMLVKVNHDDGGWILKAPAGGIPGRSGIRCGTANCKAYYIDESDDLIEILDRSAASLAIPVKNPFATAIAADAYITAKRVRGKLVVDAEDCG